jgi:Protein of unknown function (DUF3097)
VPGRDPYAGILAGPVDGPRRVAAVYPEAEARPGLPVEHRHTRVRGRVVRIEGDAVVVRTELGTERVLALTPGAFAVDGKPTTLVRARPQGSAAPPRTASGSRPAADRAARVAHTSRIWVEGIHDAELVEKVWGDDLRAEGIVVERLDGIDHLAVAVASFGPGPDARLGVLVDHLVPGSKEARVAASAEGPHVLVTGTPFVDVWQAIRPQAVGIDRWPEIPKGLPWKEGICAALGVADPPEMWRLLLGSVRTYADLEPALVGAVERLVDFVTESI